MRSFASRRLAVLVLPLAVLLHPAAAAAQSDEAAYTQTLAREAVLRKDLDSLNGGTSAPLLARIRTLVREYEAVANRYPRSGYSDNALYQAAVLSGDAYWGYGEDVDRERALRLFKAVRSRYPSSSLIREIRPQAMRLEEAPKIAAAAAAAALATTATSGTASAPRPDARVTLKAIRREVLPDVLRVTLELEREVRFREERLDGPPRVFVDLQRTGPAADLRDVTLGFPDDVVRSIRVGRQPEATRVVFDLEGVERHSVYPLYDPYRVVIDFERKPATPRAPTSAPAVGAAVASGGDAEAPAAGDAATPAAREAGIPPAREAAIAPGPPSANGRGGFSLSRQLGLGISRVVIDPGHGGHDPGAHVKGLSEADLTLDVALRLEKLLLAVQGVEVILTRRTNVYVPLEERTAIANRAQADLFLSIHANASRNAKARGIETYFLNFAPNPEAEAVAARENAASSKTMHHLPDIVKAIALNNKLDESRDFASLVQGSMYARLRKSNSQARNLGVKQAPFVVLIGATMPSVLAEISFLTNRQEASLLRTPNYRQAIAEALFEGISKYQRSLKSANTVASQ
jgi:N-acetylmuramoyl-L-alanine amidase